MNLKSGAIHILPIIFVSLFLAGYVLYTSVNKFNVDTPSVLSEEDQATPTPTPTSDN